MNPWLWMSLMSKKTFSLSGETEAVAFINVYDDQIPYHFPPYVLGAFNFPSKLQVGTALFIQ